MYYLYGIENKAWAVKDLGNLSDLQKEKATTKLSQLPKNPLPKNNFTTQLYIDPKDLSVKYIQEPSVVNFPLDGWVKWNEKTQNWQPLEG